MKEIDFLPEWYKSKRRRQMRYRMQYAAILCVFAAMVGWSFFAAKSVINAQAITQQQKLSPAQQQSLAECGQIQEKLIKLGVQAEQLKKLDSKVALADVLAELSYLVDSRIVLTQIDMQAEGFEDNNQSSANGASLVRVTNSSASLFQSGDVRFKVILQGMACEAGDIARLIRKLEESSYFCRIMPGFSRTNKVKDRQVSEFEICCCIANYKEAKR